MTSNHKYCTTFFQIVAFKESFKIPRMYPKPDSQMSSDRDSEDEISDDDDDDDNISENRAEIAERNSYKSAANKTKSQTYNVKYECRICGKKNTSRYKLNQHETTHLGEFSESMSLTYHCLIIVTFCERASF